MAPVDLFHPTLCSNSADSDFVERVSSYLLRKCTHHTHPMTGYSISLGVSKSSHRMSFWTHFVERGIFWFTTSPPAPLWLPKQFSSEERGERQGNFSCHEYERAGFQKYVCLLNAMNHQTLISWNEYLLIFEMTVPRVSQTGVWETGTVNSPLERSKNWRRHVVAL